MNEQTLGARLRNERTSAGLSQTDLSESSGIPKPTLSRYENDHVMPSISTLRRLATALGIHEANLLPRKGTAGEALLDALRDRGIEIRSTAEAERLADLIAESFNKTPRRS